VAARVTCGLARDGYKEGRDSAITLTLSVHRNEISTSIIHVATTVHNHHICVSSIFAIKKILCRNIYMYV